MFIRLKKNIIFKIDKYESERKMNSRAILVHLSIYFYSSLQNNAGCRRTMKRRNTRRI